MVLCTLINISLDVSSGIVWWAFKNTLYGTYCVGRYLINKRNPPQHKTEFVLLREDIEKINTKIDLLNHPNIVMNVVVLNPLQNNLENNLENTLENNLIPIEDEFIWVEQEN
jgi:hypothetical protein